MNLQSQVVSLELAKRLKELGVKQEGAVCWRYSKAKTIPNWKIIVLPEEVTPGRLVICSAFSVAELGEILPCGIYSYRFGSGFRALADGELWSREGGVTLEGRPFFDASAEADARAKMLIYLIEKGLVKP